VNDERNNARCNCEFQKHAVTAPTYRLHMTTDITQLRGFQAVSGPARVLLSLMRFPDNMALLMAESSNRSQYQVTQCS
jgi:hypothetical protein